MNILNALEQLDALGLPEDEYAIVSSGALAIRGIREAHDLDILVTEKLWQELRKKYTLTATFPVENIDIGDVQILGHGSIYRDSDIASVAAIIDSADIISGHRFATLEMTRAFKKKEGREKDLNDIILIEKYLSQKS